MSTAPRILVIAATARELAPAAGWRTLECGVGPVEAAAAVAAAITADRPAAILHVGIAGARRARGLALGSLVIGTEAHYDDLGLPPKWAPNTVVASPMLIAAAALALPAAPQLAICTSARVGGSEHGDVEAMEGFGVLRAAERAGVPAVEVRAISNEIEEGDRRRWMFEAAFAAITQATPRLVAAIAAALERGPGAPVGAPRAAREP